MKPLGVQWLAPGTALVVLLRWLPLYLEDPSAQICETVLWFSHNPRAFTLVTDSNAVAFVESCRAVFDGLEAPVQRRLHRMLHDGTLTAHLEDTWESSIPSVEGCLSKCGLHAALRPLQDLPEEDREAYRNTGFLPLQEKTIDLHDVQWAFQHGHVARIDGRRLLPSSMFNVSFADLSRLHPGIAGEIPIYKGQGWMSDETCHDWLMYLRMKCPQWGPRSLLVRGVRKLVFPLLLRYVCSKPDMLKEVGEWSKRFPDRRVPFRSVSSSKPEAHKLANNLVNMRMGMPASNINLRQLPNFDQQVDVAASLDLGSMVELTHNVLWFGHSPGGWHTDVPDNVVIQLSSESTWVVFPPNCSSALYQTVDFQRAALTVVQNRLPKGTKRAPFFHVVLRPGDGLVIPSMSMHRVISKSSQRVALNSFFEPRFGRMQWEGNIANAYRRLDKDNLAMRTLWLRSMRHLWEERKLQMFWHTERVPFV